MNVAGFAVLGVLLLAASHPAPADTCPRTLGTKKVFSQPWPEAATWYGSEGLAVMLPHDGILPTTVPGARLAAKVFWYSASLDADLEPSEYGYEEDFSGRVERLDDGLNDAVMSPPTNAGGPSLGAWTILTGVDFPSPGCWKITGEFRGQTLSFVVETIEHDRYLGRAPDRGSLDLDEADVRDEAYRIIAAAEERFDCKLEEHSMRPIGNEADVRYVFHVRAKGADCGAALVFATNMAARDERVLFRQLQPDDVDQADPRSPDSRDGIMGPVLLPHDQVLIHEVNPDVGITPPGD